MSEMVEKVVRARDVLTEQIVGPSPGWSIDVAEADAIIAALDAAGFVIVPKDVRQDAVIRTAVNDMLEQAAVMALCSGAHENVAENIRTLKHPTSS